MKSREAFIIGFFSFFGFLPNAFAQKVEETMRQNVNQSVSKDWFRVGMDFRRVFERERVKANEAASKK